MFLGPHTGGSYGPYIQVCSRSSVHRSSNSILLSSVLSVVTVAAKYAHLVVAVRASNTGIPNTGIPP